MRPFLLAFMMVAASQAIIMVQENTTWHYDDFHQGVLILGEETSNLEEHSRDDDRANDKDATERDKRDDTGVMVFPNVHLKIVGKSVGQPLTVLFVSPGSKIELQAGASIELEDVVFQAHTISSSADNIFSQKKVKRAREETSDMVGKGRGIITLSKAKNAYTDGVTVMATRFRCHGLFSCISISPHSSVQVRDSTFVVTGNGLAIGGTEFQGFAGKCNIDDSVFRTYGSSGAIACQKGLVRGSIFHSFNKSSAVQLRYGGHVESSTFRGYGTAIYGLQREEPSRSIATVVNTTIQGYSYGCANIRSIHRCILERNRVAVADADEVKDSYFLQNGVGCLESTNIVSSVFRENKVATVVIRRHGWEFRDLCICCSLVGISSTGWSQNPDEPNANITMLNNRVAYQTNGAMPQMAAINFVGSTLYDISNVGTETMEVSSLVYFDSVPKILDGRNGGGPGLVSLNKDNQSSARYWHPTSSELAPDCGMQESLKKLHVDMPTDHLSSIDFILEDIRGLPEHIKSNSVDFVAFLASLKKNDSLNTVETMEETSGSENFREADDLTKHWKFLNVTEETKTCAWLQQNTKYCTLAASAVVACPVTCGVCSAKTESSFDTVQKLPMAANDGDMTRHLFAGLVFYTVLSHVLFFTGGDIVQYIEKQRANSQHVLHLFWRLFITRLYSNL